MGESFEDGKLVEAGRNAVGGMRVWPHKAAIAIASTPMDHSLADARRGLIGFLFARAVRFSN
tara:strand:+ start:243740 stop:243925 length:186 start_codon:yes stop_codon:yes gene_type:complete